MKALKLTIHNIGCIADTAIDINKPELVFYGEVMQGKTTILNAIRWVLGCAFPADILRHGTQEAFVQYEGLENDGKPFVIRREWYVGEDGTTKARPLIYTRAGIPVSKPVTALQQHANPFALDQDHLRNMGAAERNRFLVNLFGVDTYHEDQGIAAAQSTASQLRTKIAGYGIIDLTPVERADVQSLQNQLAEVNARNNQNAEKARQIKADHEAAEREVKEAHSRIAAREGALESVKTRIREVERQIGELQKQLVLLKDDEVLSAKAREEASSVLLPAAVEKAKHTGQRVLELDGYAPESTLAIVEQIAAAGAQNAKADAYEKAKVQAAARDADKQRLREQEAVVDQLKQKKVEKLQAIGAATGIPGLVFTEEGFTFEGAAHDMISDSQMMRLSELLSAKYPEGLGISLIDRGESLGKSVLTLWKDAQQRNATVLVTVVGDKPAVVPDEVGAFVVENGQVR